MRQKPLTIITPVKPDRVGALYDLLNQIGQSINENKWLDFSLFETVHFMRWVVLEASSIRGKEIPAYLVLSTNYDGPLSRHFDDLFSTNLAAFQAIYAHCEGAPANLDKGEWTRYMLKYRVGTAAFYRGTNGRRLRQIRLEQDLWNRIQNLTDEATTQNGQDLGKHIRAGVKNDDALSWAQSPYRPEWEQRFGRLFLIVMVLVILGLMVVSWVFWPWVAGVTTLTVISAGLVWWLRLKRHEKQDQKDFQPVLNDPQRVALLARREDFKTQNQITHLVEVKPGWARQFALRFVLWAINLLARFVYNQGNLGGIQSIHYARWVLLDGGRRLLFFSNYDGSWESYLGEFVNRAAVGLTGVWSNTVGFPPTSNLIRDGARHSADFKAWAREKQIETQVWYSAYPHLSLKNINNNTAIRQGIYRKLNSREMEAWLQRI